MGFIALAISLASFPALLSGSSGLKRPRKARKLVDKSAIRDPLFVVFTCSSFTCFLGYIIPYFYIPTYAQDHLGVSPEFALYILVIAIAGSFFGRLTCGYVAHYAGNMMTWIACAFISGLLSLCWIRIETEKSFIAFSALWGRQDSSFLQFEQTAHRDIVYRLLLCRACHTTRFLLPQYLSRPLAPGHSTRHVLGRFLHRNLDWGADCRSAAYDV
jgi:predicted MFS family arabinose efflux permease